MGFNSITDDCMEQVPAAAAYKAENRSMDTELPFRFVTASLQVDYLVTPLKALEFGEKWKEIKGRGHY
jgi:hypothetical protein